MKYLDKLPLSTLQRKQLGALGYKTGRQCLNGTYRDEAAFRLIFSSSELEVLRSILQEMVDSEDWRPYLNDVLYIGMGALALFIVLQWLFHIL
jgi:hypothetical protein